MNWYGFAVPDQEAADALPKIKAQISIPLIADVHFDHRLALKAAEVVDCVRINPGNIGPWWRLAEVIKAVQDRGHSPPGSAVNGGSLERPLLEKYGYPHGRGSGRIGVECRPRHRGHGLHEHEGVVESLRRAHGR